MILSVMMTLVAQFAVLSPVFADINKGLTGIGAGLAVGLVRLLNYEISVTHPDGTC